MLDERKSKRVEPYIKPGEERMKSWETHSELVLAELRRLSEQTERLNNELHKTRLDIIEIQTKAKSTATIWGSITSAVISIASLIVQYFFLRN